MMRLVMEAVMVLTVVGILAFMMKIGANDGNAEKSLRDDDNQDSNDS